MSPPLLRAEFIEGKTRCTLPELRCAFEIGVIGARTLVDLAMASAARGADDPITTSLAALSHAELPDARPLIERIPLSDEEHDQHLRKWTWLLAAWLFEHHRDDDVVFDHTHALYVDLGYPAEIAFLSQYAPYEGDRTPAVLRKHLLTQWANYLEEGRETFGHGCAQTTPGPAAHDTRERDRP